MAKVEGFGTDFFCWAGFRYWAGHDLGDDYHSLVVPAWIFVPLALVPAASLRRFARGARWRQRLRAGLCPTCGYDLRASKEKCPECGSPIPPTARHPAPNP